MHVTRNRSKLELVCLRWRSSVTSASFSDTATCPSHRTSCTCSTSTILETFSSTSGLTKNFGRIFFVESNLRPVTRGWISCLLSRAKPDFTFPHKIRLTQSTTLKALLGINSLCAPPSSRAGYGPEKSQNYFHLNFLLTQNKGVNFKTFSAGCNCLIIYMLDCYVKAVL